MSDSDQTLRQWRAWASQDDARPEQLTRSELVSFMRAVTALFENIEELELHAPSNADARARKAIQLLRDSGAVRSRRPKGYQAPLSYASQMDFYLTITGGDVRLAFSGACDSYPEVQPKTIAEGIREFWRARGGLPERFCPLPSGASPEFQEGRERLRREREKRIRRYQRDLEWKRLDAEQTRLRRRASEILTGAASPPRPDESMGSSG